VLKNKTFLAVIPARGGSKRIPNKNVIELNGKPLIAWTIEAAKKSKYIDEIILSTDSEKIAKIASKYRINIPFIRPTNLSSDKARSIDVLIHAVNSMKENNKNYDFTLMLQPTSPLRDNNHIDESIEYLFEKKANSIIGVTKLNHPIEWANKLPQDFSMKNFFDQNNIIKRSQDYDASYLVNGAIYIIKNSILLEEKKLFLNENCYAYEMDISKSIDIDTKQDLKMAEVLLKNDD